MTARRHLWDRHRELLTARGICDQVIADRGYESTAGGDLLLAEGFSHAVAALGPGLLIPVWDVHGQRRYTIFRPDKPRGNSKGKPVKYETPRSTRLAIDVPPRAVTRIDDPQHPLYVTESVMKADALVSAGLVAVGLNGVYGWRGTNAKGGKTVSPDLEYIALNDRDVYLAPDSDVAANTMVNTAVRRCGGMLDGRGAAVFYITLPSLNGGKTGVDDYLATMGPAEGRAGLLALADDEPPARPARAAGDPPSAPSAVRSHPHTPPDWAADQDILARLVRDMGKWCGFTGEERNAKVTYLAITSRILGDPVSVAFKGQSSSGKSYTVAAVLKFFPEDAAIVMTAMSERALVYMKEPFAHRTLVLFEAVALREEREKTESNLTAYIIRSLLSEGEIRYPVAVRDSDGQLVTRTIVKQGPTNLIITTTAASVHGENETRLLSLPTDDSAAQTTAIMKAIAAGQPAEGNFAEWHDYAAWLAEGNTRVHVPYAGWLAENIPPVAVRLRRDFRAILRLIEVHAIMHQLSRKTDEQGRIVADEADYLAVRALVADLVSDALGATVRPVTRETVQAVARLDRGNGVKVHDLAVHLGLERSSVAYRVSAARDRGYLVNDEDKRGKPGRWKLDSPLPDDVVILPERIEGVKPHPGPVHHTPGDAAPQASEGPDGGCEGVNEPRGGQAGEPVCTACGLPMDPEVTAATGWTTHPCCGPDGDAGQP